MTEPTPTPEKQNSPASPGSETQSDETSTSATGFFNRVRRELKPKPEPIHPSEAKEIVIMDEGDADDRT